MCKISGQKYDHRFHQRSLRFIGYVTNLNKQGLSAELWSTSHCDNAREYNATCPGLSEIEKQAELSIEHKLLGRLTRCVGLKIYVPRLMHGLLEGDLNRCLQFYEAILNDKQEGDSSLHKSVVV